MKVGPLIFAAALAAFLVLRRRRLEVPLLVAGAIAVVALCVYGAGLVELPDLEQLLLDVGDTLGKWTYLLVGGLAFLETGAFIGLLVPGETAMILGGVVAGQGRIDVVTLIGIVWAAAVAGDCTSYYLGRRLGRDFLVAPRRRAFRSRQERLETVERFFERHGGKAIFIGRFVGLVRAIAPFLAGSGRMPFRRFLPFDILGAGLWATTFILLGYVFWHSLNRVARDRQAGRVRARARHQRRRRADLGRPPHFREEENRAAFEARLLRALDRPRRGRCAVLRPGRAGGCAAAGALLPRAALTPGQLGLELTTLFAVAAVGSFAFIGSWSA